MFALVEAPDPVPGAFFRRTSAPRFAERALWNIDSGSASVRLDVEGPDDLGPFLGFVGDELAKVGGRAGKNRAAQAGTLLSLSIICGGVFLGAPTPYHWLASKPGRNSPIVGMPGSVSERVALATASARSVPALMYSIDAGRELNMTCT